MKHSKNMQTAGKSLQEADKALIMLHGRGATARDILGLAPHLAVKDFALLAPQATNHTWYPYSFMAPQAQNEPWLSSALALLEEIVEDVKKQGVATENIYFLGFSQGACLTLEFVARYAARWGGAVAFTGGLIGDTLNTQNYRGDFGGTPIFIGTSNPDPHVPVSRVQETTALLKSLHAQVTEKVWNNMGHTIIQEELDLANRLVFKSL